MSTPDEVPAFPFPDDGRLAIPEQFADLRARCPVQRVELPFGGQGWLVSRHADVKAVLGDPRFSRAATVDADVPRTTPWRTQAGNLMAMDPPEHTRTRRLVAPVFSRRGAERLRPRTEEIVGELIAGLRRAGGPVDFVEAFAMPLPVTVICELLGVPADRWHLFRDFSEKVFGDASGSAEEAERAAAELDTFLAGLVAQRRAEPRDDLLSEMVAARDADGARLSEEELVTLGVTILVSGHETTAAAVGNYVYTLLTQGLWRDLAARPEQLDTALEELLRAVPIGGAETMPRMATEDVTVAGTVVREGEAVFPVMLSANFDESVFAEPDKLDLHRSPNPHLAFGFGPHVCLGAQLALMELRVALGRLLAEFPTLRLAVDEADVPWRTGSMVRGPRRLMVTW
ncbi:putative cytochrome P450 [Actinoplanes missouriensis 431]|uniref:Putative cytochrome P450 n=1 Tax=Actinoplanes missouriensis (strain ATCC 14538 / DSM 43046 / CBS 188.64 / JCM 3121 / NBRC 102363 / NCIMB 12654 / NRRL B-3342 / UNCC 431) TaxID=512565 RepID=I0HB88_ACTM4|nr:cytochrome P450 [Actinoplanes missouriensis]BAL90275.1 putative cytochrome P450 [Actinoplanes missouriensis 431]